MYDFSFAYMKEAFVATLLVIAGNRTEKSILAAAEGTDYEEFANAFVVGGGDDGGDGGDDDLDDFELWREMKKQVIILREDMDSSKKAEDNGLLDPPEPNFDEPLVSIDAEGRVTIEDHPAKGKGPQAMPVRGRSENWGEFVRDAEVVGGAKV